MSVDTDLAYWQQELATAKRKVADCDQHIATLQQQKQRQLADQARTEARQAEAEADTSTNTASGGTGNIFNPFEDLLS